MISRISHPEEFLGGYVIANSGLAKPLQVVIDPDLPQSHHFDAVTGVFSLNADVYEKKRGIEMDALFRIPNLRFQAGWRTLYPKDEIDPPEGYARKRSHPEGRKKIIASELWKDVGQVSLSDALENKILIGGHIYSKLPQRLWDSIPEGIRLMYEREGFHVDFEDVRQMTESLEKILADRLPRLLIKGFLSRVISPAKPEDLRSIPLEYFIQNYDLDTENSVGADIMSDAAYIANDAVHVSRGTGHVDFKKYNEERNLNKLLTVIPFIPHPDRSGRLLSLKDLYIWVHDSKGPAKAARHVKQTGFFPSKEIHRRLNELFDSYKTDSAIKEEIATLGSESIRGSATLLDNEWPVDSVVNPQWRLFFEWFESLVRRYFSGNFFCILSTKEDLFFADAAYQKVEGKHQIVLPLGERLQEYVTRFIRGLHDEKLLHEQMLHTLDTVTHELTHLTKENIYKPDFTHDGLFFDQQMGLLLNRGRSRLSLDRVRKRFLNRAVGLGVDPAADVPGWRDVLTQLGTGKLRKRMPYRTVSGGVTRTKKSPGL